MRKSLAKRKLKAATAVEKNIVSKKKMSKRRERGE
jgi:hypothetical protein